MSLQHYCEHLCWWRTRPSPGTPSWPTRTASPCSCQTLIDPVVSRSKLLPPGSLQQTRPSCTREVCRGFCAGRTCHSAPWPQAEIEDVMKSIIEAAIQGRDKSNGDRFNTGKLAVNWHTLTVTQAVGDKVHSDSTSLLILSNESYSTISNVRLFMKPLSPLASPNCAY